MNARPLLNLMAVASAGLGLGRAVWPVHSFAAAPEAPQHVAPVLGSQETEEDQHVSYDA